MKDFRGITLDNNLRVSGLDLIGDVPWGTHLCQFYRTRHDMLQLLVPYFKAGLEGNEFCMWVTSDPLTVEDAENALRDVVPDFDEKRLNGQVEVVPHTDWYMKDGYFDLNRVFDGWKSKLAGALERGFDGLRASGNTAWLEANDWESFTEYEEELERIIGDYQMMAVCTYSVDKCSATEVIDVVSNHQFAVIERDGELEIIQSTERRKAREAVKRTEERYRRLIENIHDAIIITDTEFKITGWNNAAVRIYGYSAGEAEGRYVGELLQTAYPNGDTRESTRERLARDGHLRVEVLQRRKNDTVIPIDAIVIELRDPAGVLEGYVSVNRDITARREAEESLKRLSEELLWANSELDAYARAVSHDLRGPLSAAALANDMLRDELTNPDLEKLRAEVEESTRVIERNIGKCDNLINDLLALAEAGREPVRVSEVDVKSIVQDIIAEKGALLRESGCRVLVGDDLGRVRANATQIYQLFSNLISNAVRHNDSSEPVVEVRFLGAEADGSRRYIVRDNGSGIPEEYLDDVFKPFFKRGASSDTGMGLPIAKKVVETYGGEIRVYNEGGACFEFFIYDA